MRSQGARFKATQAANIRCNAPCQKKIWSSLSVKLAKARVLYASFVSLILEAVGLTVIMLLK